MVGVVWERALLLDMYRTMLTIRLCEESFVPFILGGTIRCPVHLYTGQEAVATGLCKTLRETDYVFGNHRSHGHFLAKGGSLMELVAEVYCRETGCSRGRGGSMHLLDVGRGMLGSAPIVAGTISLALGAALAAKIRRDKRVVVSFFGDGAAGEGVLYEAMNFAAVTQLPIIFACENNLYSTHMPISEIRMSTQISDVAGAFKIPSYVIDGNDLVAVYKASVDVVAACRAGGGPAFMEFLTYRMRGHVGPNDNIQGTQTDIRPAEEIAKWQARDPIPRFEAFVLDGDWAKSEDIAAIRDIVAHEVGEAHRFAAASPRPLESEIGKYVFHG
ncbi:MAG: thiamine pyrophosphate-dependent dehydrogenase E1 component subunit alpha [Candidatus Latescibacteria bacterium]|nr:thiamine pyrophosphate-dependent dehydrogenase E1 component subunit alpha [Candidatus Latescibacterota bacterium]